ncbi:glutathione S-transferase U9-like [Chenopodium quinoa]|uniref:Glutathione S-transferase n=1 Tax=Chenopodium quinoa TaxID=63459 RepID=A0A803M163_CHEQI|nr:glutathione S-transferase U9-like [Chenopodium quinoa]
MEDEKKVVFLGFFASPYARWVKIALKIKGITYEYVEENLKKKSQMLLQYNPIHKKVPVLIHKGNPVSESLVILQYIDETWKNSPHLLPSDPYSRSVVQFWADYMVNQLDMSLKKVIASSQGIEEEKSIREVQMKFNILEENMKVIFPYDAPSCNEDMGMLDMLLCAFPSIIKGIEDAFNLKLMEPQKYPLTTSRMASLWGLNVVRDTAPPHERLVKFYRAYRNLCSNF